jgi:NAD-dependent dihydropyrimidine dehydrogenase PreA subunit
MLDILTDITEGRGTEQGLANLQELAEAVKQGSLCALGQTAPNPVLTTLRYFREEYEAHIREKRCPAGVCRALVKYEIVPDKCTGCAVCLRACPQEAISGKRREPHLIDQEKCIQCGACYEVCRFDAIVIGGRNGPAEQTAEIVSQ